MKKIFEGGSLPSGKSTISKLNFINRSGKSSLTLLPVPSLQQEVPRHTTSEMFRDQTPGEKHLEQKARFACSSQYQASNHQTARLSNRSPQYFPFVCATRNIHFIAGIFGPGPGLFEVSIVHFSSLQGHYAMLSSLKRKRAFMLGYPKISTKTRSGMFPQALETAFEKKESHPQIFAIAGLHLAF